MVVSRCKWAQNITDPEYLEYHDTEWGSPVRSDESLFELLTLEGAMAGLSWLIILRKRKYYRNEFANFDINMVAKMTQLDVEKILHRGNIVNHSGKIKSVIVNANALLDLIEEFGSISSYFNTMLKDTNVCDLAITTAPVSNIATKISKDLKKRGFTFVGPTTVQSFLQAAGFFHCHDEFCFRNKT